MRCIREEREYAFGNVKMPIEATNQITQHFMRNRIKHAFVFKFCAFFSLKQFMHVSTNFRLLIPINGMRNNRRVAMIFILLFVAADALI